jgi:hypothetical protein
MHGARLARIVGGQAVDQHSPQRSICDGFLVDQTRYEVDRTHDATEIDLRMNVFIPNWPTGSRFVDCGRGNRAVAVGADGPQSSGANSCRKPRRLESNTWSIDAGRIAARPREAVHEAKLDRGRRIQWESSRLRLWPQPRLRCWRALQ